MMAPTCLPARDPKSGNRFRINHAPSRPENNRSRNFQRLVRYGAPGREKPGIIGDDGKIRDLSAL
jgi:hypothetical protein